MWWILTIGPFFKVSIGMKWKSGVSCSFRIICVVFVSRVLTGSYYVTSAYDIVHKAYFCIFVFN